MAKHDLFSLYLRVVWLVILPNSFQWLVVMVSWTILSISIYQLFLVKLVVVTVVPLSLSIKVKATTYSIMRIEERGTIFINPGTEVYEEWSLVKTLVKMIWLLISTAKQMTNVRSATKDQTAVIKTPRILTLEESLEFLNDDEYMEVTPEPFVFVKQVLNKAERDKTAKRKISDWRRIRKRRGMFYLILAMLLVLFYIFDQTIFEEPLISWLQYLFCLCQL